MTAKNLEQQLEEAQLEATNARNRAQELERAIIAGDTKVTIADVEAEESKARYADLRARSTERNLEEARKAERESAINAIRHEIETTDLGNPEYFTSLLKAVEDAQLNLIEAAGKRTAQIRDWRKQLIGLGIENYIPGASLEPAEGIAPIRPLGSGTPSIRIDGRRVGAVDADSLLSEIFKIPEAKRRNKDIYVTLRQQIGEPTPSTGSRKKS